MKGIDGTMAAQSQTALAVTVAFRVPPDRKHLIRAAAASKREKPSDWLRRVTEAALAHEFGLSETENAEDTG